MEAVQPSHRVLPRQPRRRPVRRLLRGQAGAPVQGKPSLDRPRAPNSRPFAQKEGESEVGAKMALPAWRPTGKGPTTTLLLLLLPRLPRLVLVLLVLVVVLVVLLLLLVLVLLLLLLPRLVLVLMLLMLLPLEG
jgi:hypothetical protein